jgi:hypothetical protein
VLLDVVESLGNHAHRSAAPSKQALWDATISFPQRKMCRKPSGCSDHLAAAAVFGNPSSAFADSLSPGPLPAMSPLYACKTIDLRVPNDPICTNGWDMRAHTAYVETGMVNQAATFAAGRL